MNSMNPSITPSRSGFRRWFVALVLAGGIVALLAITLTVVLMALPLTRRLIFVGLAEALLGGRLETLAVDLEIQPSLKWLFSSIVILPVGFGLARMVMARDFSKAARGLAVALGTLLAVGIYAWVGTQHFNFDAQGRPVVYLSFHRDGVRKSFYPGIDRVTGRPKEAVSPDRAVWLTELVRQPVRVVNPAVETNWFDANSGEPNLWFVELAPGQWQFFNRPHFHQQIKVEVQPVTPEFMAQWQAEQARLAAEAAAERLRTEAQARALAEKKEREEQLRVERRRLAEIAAKAEAEAKVRAEAELRARESQLLREQVNARQRQQAADEAARLTLEHQQKGVERRVREATADPSRLEHWDAARFLSRVFPELDGNHPDKQVFDDEYAGRRFRFRDRVEEIQAHSRTVMFAATVYGKMRFRISGFTRPGSENAFKAGCDAIFTATVERIETSPSSAGCVVTLYLCGLEPIAPPPVVPNWLKPAEPKAPPAYSAQPRSTKYVVAPVSAILKLPFQIVGSVLGT